MVKNKCSVIVHDKFIGFDFIAVYYILLKNIIIWLCWIPIINSHLVGSSLQYGEKICVNIDSINGLLPDDT